MATGEHSHDQAIRYDEMDGLLPFFLLIFAVILLIVFLVLVFIMKRKSKAEKMDKS